MRTTILRTMAALALMTTVALLVCETALRLAPSAMTRLVRSNEVVLYTVGESTGNGEPYNLRLSYPRIVSFMLGGRVNDRPLRIVNLSQGGSNSWEQYWLLHRSLYLSPPPRGSILLVYLGINEGTAPPGYRESIIQRIAHGSILLRKVHYLLFHNGSRYRQSYERGLADVLQLGKQFNLHIVVSDLCGNYADFAPKDTSIFGNAAAARRLQEIRAQEARGELSVAQQAYRDMLKDPTVVPDHIYFRLGRTLQQQARYDEARECYYRAAEGGNRRRPTRGQNAFIRRIAAREGVEFVSAFQAFHERSPHGLVGYNLFIDAHHPNLEGYILLASLFAERIARHFNTPLAVGHPSQSVIATHFDFGIPERFEVYINRSIWLASEASFDIDRDESIRRIAYYRGQAEDLSRKSDKCDRNKLQLLLMIEALVRKDAPSAESRLLRGGFLGRNRRYLTEPSRVYAKWINQELLKLPLSRPVASALRSLASRAGNINDKSE